SDHAFTSPLPKGTTFPCYGHVLAPQGFSQLVELMPILPTPYRRIRCQINVAVLLTNVVQRNGAAMPLGMSQFRHRHKSKSPPDWPVIGSVIGSGTFGISSKACDRSASVARLRSQSS